MRTLQRILRTTRKAIKWLLTAGGKYSFLTDLNVNNMAKYIVIERLNGVVTIVRSEIETASEEPLTEHEQIINELYSKVKKLNLTLVSKSVCDCIIPATDFNRTFCFKCKAPLPKND